MKEISRTNKKSYVREGERQELRGAIEKELNGGPVLLIFNIIDIINFSLDTREPYRLSFVNIFFYKLIKNDERSRSQCVISC